jgi:predicted DNA-binding transcriptional regulator YafY
MKAARSRRPVSLRYAAWDGRRSERTLRPYGIMAHSGRWYVTGAATCVPRLTACADAAAGNG